MGVGISAHTVHRRAHCPVITSLVIFTLERGDQINTCCLHPCEPVSRKYMIVDSYGFSYLGNPQEISRAGTQPKFGKAHTQLGNEK